MTTAECPKCKRRTKHQHLHDAAHGIAGTHMAGTERYECSECRHNIYKAEGENLGLEFWYE